MAASALMPENTASTTMIPQIGTSRCRIHCAPTALAPEIPEHRDVQEQKSAQGAEVDDRGQIVEAILHEQGHRERQRGRHQHPHVGSVVSPMDARQDSGKLPIAPHGEYHPRHSDLHRQRVRQPDDAGIGPGQHHRRPRPRRPRRQLIHRRGRVLDGDSGQQVAEHPGDGHEERRRQHQYRDDGLADDAPVAALHLLGQRRHGIEAEEGHDADRGRTEDLAGIEGGGVEHGLEGQAAVALAGMQSDHSQYQKSDDDDDLQRHRDEIGARGDRDAEPIHGRGHRHHRAGSRPRDRRRAAATRAPPRSRHRRRRGSAGSRAVSSSRR